MKNNKSLSVFLIFFLLVVSNSRYLINLGINSLFEATVILLILVEIIYLQTKNKINYSKKEKIYFLVVIILFTIGLVLNNLEISAKFRLILTMIAMSCIILKSGNILNDYKYIRISSYGILSGIFFTTIISILSGTSVFEKIYGNVYLFNYGFTGGLQYKNYFSAALLGAFIGIFLYYRNEKKLKIDFLTLLLIILLDILSGSSGGLILLFVFLFSYFILDPKRKKVIARKNIVLSKNLKIFLIFISVIITSLVIFVSFKYILPHSSTYIYRIRGISNYLDCFKNDYFHLIFGNSEMAFSNSEYGYVENIKRFLTYKGYDGYSGTYEMGFINVLIKNGILGIIGFFLSYFLILKKATKVTVSNRCCIYAIFIVLMVSSFVESYVCNLHAIFGVYCYLTIAGLLNMNNSSYNPIDL